MSINTDERLTIDVKVFTEKLERLIRQMEEKENEARLTN